MYPSFIIVTPFRDFIKTWGEIPLNRVPSKDEMDIDQLYFLLISLGLHSIAPKDEFNRLALRFIVSRKFDVDWKSPQVSSLSGVFSALYIYYKLINNKIWQMDAKRALEWIVPKLNSIAKHPLQKLALNYYNYLLGKNIEEEYREIVEVINEIFASLLPLKDKADEFFDVIYELVKQDINNPKQIRNAAQSFSMSIGGPSGENKNKSWGKNWRVEKDKKDEDITPEQLSELAKINQKAAMELAKKLDKKLDEKIKEKNQAETEKGSGGFLPGFSNRLKMLQKLLSQRRYLAAIRKIRIDEILSAVRERPAGPKRLAMRGHTTWELGDREEELDIEMSLETYGHLIPNKTTLKALYEEDTDGTKMRGIGHIEIIIDTSGSMNGPPLETAIDIAVALTEAAKKNYDSVALVTFSSGAWEGLPPSYDYDYIIDILLRLIADGGTNLRGAIKLVERHLESVNEKSAIFIITDSAVWDIGRWEVKERLFEWAVKHTLYMIATTDELYDETEYSLRGSEIRLIRVSPWQEGSWEIILSEYEKL